MTQLDNLGQLAAVADRGLDASDKFANEAVSLLTSGAMSKA